MKILVFAACILAAVMVGDALLINIIENITSKLFDIKDQIDFHLMLAECAMKFGLLKVPKPELTYCMAQKKNFIDKEGGLLWDESVNYLKIVVRDKNTWKESWDELLKKCKEEYDKFEGSGYEKSLKSMECGLPIIEYIVRQKM